MKRRTIISILIALITLGVVFWVIFVEKVEKPTPIAEQLFGKEEIQEKDSALLRFLKRRDRGSRFGFRIRTADDLFSVFKSKNAKKDETEKQVVSIEGENEDEEESSSGSGGPSFSSGGGSTSSNSGSSTGGGNIFNPPPAPQEEEGGGEDEGSQSIFIGDNDDDSSDDDDERGDVTDCLVEYQVYDDSNCTSISQ